MPCYDSLWAHCMTCAQYSCQVSGQLELLGRACGCWNWEMSQRWGWSAHVAALSARWSTTPLCQNPSSKSLLGAYPCLQHINGQQYTCHFKVQSQQSRICQRVLQGMQWIIQSSCWCLQRQTVPATLRVASLAYKRAESHSPCLPLRGTCHTHLLTNKFASLAHGESHHSLPSHTQSLLSSILKHSHSILIDHQRTSTDYMVCQVVCTPHSHTQLLLTTSHHIRTKIYFPLSSPYILWSCCIEKKSAASPSLVHVFVSVFLHSHSHLITK